MVSGETETVYQKFQRLCGTDAHEAAQFLIEQTGLNGSIESVMSAILNGAPEKGHLSSAYPNAIENLKKKSGGNRYSS